MPTYYGHEISEEIAKLIRAYKSYEEDIWDLRAKQRDITSAVNRLWVSESKPNFPTPGHIDGIKNAIHLIREGARQKDRHGDSCDPEKEGWVKVETSRRWMSVEHKAPLGFQTGGGRLWGFTDEDLDAFREIIEGSGADIFDWWKHDLGVSYILHVEEVHR